jgi:hypothetical protein
MKKDAAASFFVAPRFVGASEFRREHTNSAIKNGGIEPPFFAFSSDITCRCAAG